MGKKKSKKTPQILSKILPKIHVRGYYPVKTIEFLPKDVWHCEKSSIQGNIIPFIVREYTETILDDVFSEEEKARFISLVKEGFSSKLKTVKDVCKQAGLKSSSVDKLGPVSLLSVLLLSVTNHDAVGMVIDDIFGSRVYEGEINAIKTSLDTNFVFKQMAFDNYTNRIKRTEFKVRCIDSEMFEFISEINFDTNMKGIDLSDYAGIWIFTAPVNTPEYKYVIYNLIPIPIGDGNESYLVDMCVDGDHYGSFCIADLEVEYYMDIPHWVKVSEKFFFRYILSLRSGLINEGEIVGKESSPRKVTISPKHKSMLETKRSGKKVGLHYVPPFLRELKDSRFQKEEDGSNKIIIVKGHWRGSSKEANVKKVVI